jgi:hypothetical protein
LFFTVLAAKTRGRAAVDEARACASVATAISTSSADRNIADHDLHVLEPFKTTT